MPPNPFLVAVRGRPAALDDLADIAGHVGSGWHARAVLLLDAMDAAAVADLRGLRVETAAARQLQVIGAQLVDAGDAIGLFARALRTVDHLIDHHGVTTASQAAVARWLLAHRNDETDPETRAILGRLPDGRRRSLEDFEQMSASERMQWVDAFIGTSGDTRHRAISGVLAYLADSGTIRGDDRSVFGDTWWSVADAAVLLVIQDGWLRHHGLATPFDRPHGPDDPRARSYEAAVEAWADHVAAIDRGGLADDEALESWVRAEQAGVEYAQVEVDFTWQRDPTFVRPTRQEWEAITELAPGTHTFRLSILADTEREFVLSIVDAMITHGVDALVPDPETGLTLLPSGVLVPTGFVDVIGDRIGEIGGGWTDNWGLGAATNVVGGAIGAMTLTQRFGREIATTTVEFAATAAARAMADQIEWLTPDVIEREIARGLVDPTIVPAEPLRAGFDLLFGTDRVDDGLSFTYYFPMLIESGWLPPLPGHWVDERGNRRPAPTPAQAGPLRSD